MPSPVPSPFLPSMPSVGKSPPEASKESRALVGTIPDTEGRKAADSPPRNEGGEVRSARSPEGARLVYLAKTQQECSPGLREFLEQLASDCPPIGVKCHRRDLEIVRQHRRPEELAERLEGAKRRGKIEELSYKSRQRLAFTAANTLTNFRSMFTFTYPEKWENDGRRVKRDLNSILTDLRRAPFLASKLEYLWFLEFQKRGAPHFHILTNQEVPKPRAILRRKGKVAGETNLEALGWISERWYSIVGSGDEKHFRAGSAFESIRKQDGAARYVVKYAYKTEQKSVPDAYQNVGRFWGCSRTVKPPERKLERVTRKGVFDLLVKYFGEEPREFKYLFGASEKEEQEENNQ